MTKDDSYSSVAKALHWLIAAIIIVQIPAGIVMHNLPFSDTKFTMYQFHKSFGLIVLALSLFRLYWRLTHRAPALETTVTGWQRVAARFSHTAFYVLIIAIPLTGWLMVSASTTGIPTKIFFLVPVPHLPVPAGEATEDLFKEAHELLAFATLGLLALHVAAALKHHLKDRDQTLVRMLPRSLAARLSGASRAAPGSKTES